MFSGPLLAAFVVYHLYHFTLGPHLKHDEFGIPLAYENVVAGFSDPIAVALYLIAMVFLGLHLYHGVWSMFQSVGVNHPKYTVWLRRFAAKLLGRSRIDLTPLALRRGPAELRAGFERLLATTERPHFVFEMRSSVFAMPDVWNRIRASLDFILSHPEAHRFRFVTPHEALEHLGCVSSSVTWAAA